MGLGRSGLKQPGSAICDLTAPHVTCSPERLYRFSSVAVWLFAAGKLVHIRHAAVGADVGGFQGLVHDAGQVVPDRVQVHGVFRPRRERGHDLVGVIPGTVEPPVHHLLHPAAQRVEQRRCSQRGGSHRHWNMDPEHLGGQQHQARVQPGQQAGDDGIGQVREMIRSILPVMGVLGEEVRGWGCRHL